MGIGVHFLRMLFQMLTGLVAGLVHIPAGLRLVCTMAMVKIMAVLVEMMAMLVHTMAILDEILVRWAETLAMYIETWVKSEKIQHHKVCW